MWRALANRIGRGPLEEPEGRPGGPELLARRKASKGDQRSWPKGESGGPEVLARREASKGREAERRNAQGRARRKARRTREA